MSSYTILPSLNKSRVFILQKSELEKRWDPNTYHLERRNIIEALKKSGHQLEALKFVSTFKKSIVKEIPNNRPYLGLENIESNTGSYIPTSDKESISSAIEFKKGQVLFPKLRPYLNKVYFAEFDGVCSTEFHVLDSQKVSNEFLANFLRTNLVVNQTKYLMSGNTLPRLQTEDIESLLIPILKKEDEYKVNSIMRNVFAQKQKNEAEAAKLLSSIDDYLLNELEIDLPEPKENHLKNRMFISSLSKLSGNRLDPFYYNVSFDDLIKCIELGKYPTKKLSSVSKIIDTGKTPPKSAYLDSDDIDVLPVIKAGSYSGDFIDISKSDFVKSDFTGNIVYKGDIFILGAAHQAEYVGKKVYYLNEEPKQKTFFVGELVRISSDTNKCDSSFLFSTLKTSLYMSLLNREKRGQTSHLYPNDVRHLILPIPPLDKQKEIAEHITGMRQQAQQLKHKTTELLKKASEEIEEILIG